MAKVKMARNKAVKLPALLKDKIYKTGQTRGADDDEIYQNRVGRNNTVLIPYRSWRECKRDYENSYIVLVKPDDYFCDPTVPQTMATENLILGVNALVYYERRGDWQNHPPPATWNVGTTRNPLSGEYVARIPSTTASDSNKIILGFSSKGQKGAGIRVYEYAETETIKLCRLQLEALFWLCADAHAVAVAHGMSPADAQTRCNSNKQECFASNLLDFNKLTQARILNKSRRTTCPLCLQELTGEGFFSRMEQAAGRDVHDLTVTQISLFHIEELRTGALNHKPYNLGWGHHHCNVVAKDSGIHETLVWMDGVVKKNVSEGCFPRS
jgi:hypothetical protein